MVELRNIKLISMFILISGLLSSCDQVAASQKIILNGTSTKTPFLQKSTFTPTKDPPPTHTASLTASITATYTETATLTDTIEILDTDTAVPPSLTSSPASATATSKPSDPGEAGTPTVKVSITTNCRTGPGISYSKLSPLTAGKTASLIGKDKTASYWIIKDPGKTGRDCWLWGYYATATGNTKDLKVYAAPGQPTAKSSNTALPTLKKTTPAATKTPKNTATPKTPLPTNTPNLTPATYTFTPLPPTRTPIPSLTPIPSDTPLISDTPLPSSTPVPSNTPISSPYCSYASALPGEEQQIMDLINQARTSRGLPALTIKFALVDAARDHGIDMTCNGTYSHTSTNGTLAWQRIGIYTKNNRNWCYSNCCCGEIFYGGGSGLTPQQAFNWWMTHKSNDSNYTDNIHKRTILGQWYTRLGVGVIYYQHDGVIRKFYTVDFVRQ